MAIVKSRRVRGQKLGVDAPELTLEEEAAQARRDETEAWATFLEAGGRWMALLTLAKGLEEGLERKRSLDGQVAWLSAEADRAEADAGAALKNEADRRRELASVSDEAGRLAGLQARIEPLYVKLSELQRARGDALLEGREVRAARIVGQMAPIKDRLEVLEAEEREVEAAVSVASETRISLAAEAEALSQEAARLTAYATECRDRAAALPEEARNRILRGRELEERLGGLSPVVRAEGTTLVIDLGAGLAFPSAI